MQMVAEPKIILLKVNGTYILKSGTDFRQFSLLTLDFREVIIFPNPSYLDQSSFKVTSGLDSSVQY